MGIINYILPEETMIGALNKIYMGPNMLRIIKASFNDFNRDGMLNAKYLMDDPVCSTLFLNTVINYGIHLFAIHVGIAMIKIIC